MQTKICHVGNHDHDARIGSKLTFAFQVDTKDKIIRVAFAACHSNKEIFSRHEGRSIAMRNLSQGGKCFRTQFTGNPFMDIVRLFTLEEPGHLPLPYGDRVWIASDGTGIFTTRQRPFVPSEYQSRQVRIIAKARRLSQWNENLAVSRKRLRDWNNIVAFIRKYFRK